MAAKVRIAFMQADDDLKVAPICGFIPADGRFRICDKPEGRGVVASTIKTNRLIQWLVAENVIPEGLKDPCALQCLLHWCQPGITRSYLIASLQKHLALHGRLVQHSS